jgi:hypothetical protein
LEGRSRVVGTARPAGYPSPPVGAAAEGWGRRKEAKGLEVMKHDLHQEVLRVARASLAFAQQLRGSLHTTLGR